MNPAGTIDNLIESKLLNLHTAFVAKIVSMQDETMCSVQPLNRIKALGKNAQDRAVIPDVPILNHVRHYTLMKQSMEIIAPHGACNIVKVNPHPSPDNVGHIKVEPLKPGDIVFCVCADRNIAETRRGSFATPPQGHHSITDAVVVGLFGKWDKYEVL